ncbi:MAG: hypothetical protein ABSH30_10885 [Acidimicrobiales bacterium]|jgi:hypothetical protein
MSSRALLAAVALAVPLATPMLAGTAPSTRTAPSRPVPGDARELVYVANADGGPVTAYVSTSSGSVTPVETIADPQLPDIVWDPWGVAVGPSSQVFVQGFISDATTLVFGPGGATERRSFEVTSPDSESLGVDAAGYEYVMGGEGSPVVFVAAPGAAGVPDRLYHVKSLREIPTGQTGYDPWSDTLAIGSHNQVIVSALEPSGNRIEVFEGGPSGSNTAVRTISGPNTGLGACTDTSCDHVSVAYSTSTHCLDAAVSGPSGTRIEVFGPGATGNARPRRLIAGGATRLAGKVITGIAVSAMSADIFVLAKGAQFQSPGAVEVFSGSENGDVAPIYRFTDVASRFADAEGIAVGVERRSTP